MSAVAIAQLGRFLGQIERRLRLWRSQQVDGTALKRRKRFNLPGLLQRALLRVEGSQQRLAVVEPIVGHVFGKPGGFDAEIIGARIRAEHKWVVLSAEI